MLVSLRIENFALIHQLELELGNGLNVLTGETGAGKSIILDAIDTVLGGKVNQRLIRTGNRRAMVEATFSSDEALLAWLKEQEIDLLDEDSVVISREINLAKSGVRSRSRLNGTLVNLKLVEQLRERLVEITAQGQTINLMIPAKQRELLDLYGGTSLLHQREILALAYIESKEAYKALEKRRQSEQERLQRLDWLQYQIQELEKAQLVELDELEQLEQERDRLSHVVELQQLSYQAYQTLYQNDTSEVKAAHDLLSKGEAILEDMVGYDQQLEAILGMVRIALMQVVEAGQQINTYGDHLESDPQRLGEVEARISLLKQICRKYGPTLPEAIAHYQKLYTELDQLTNTSQSLEELEQNYQIQQQKLIQECQQLSQLRHQAAQKLEKNLIGELKPLAMDKVQFECRLTPCIPNATGADQVNYYFSPNPGEKIQPLSQTASGGEMSRFLLALKACFSQTEKRSRTLIFDEIDVGVSGKVAQAIAEKLNQLSHSNQVLCVTHQPLVAAMADVHFRVDKETINQLAEYEISSETSSVAQLAQTRTVVRLQKLEEKELRCQEIAQLAGGKSATEAISFAQSLLSQAQAHRQARN